MLCNDTHFAVILKQNFGDHFPFKQLQNNISANESGTSESLYRAFIRTFHADDARAARNVVAIWAVDQPYTHNEGSRLESTISYIEISRRTLAERWPKRFFRNITRDYKNKGSVSDEGDLQELADKDKNFSFYSLLIMKHGPLRIWYASLDELNEAARKANLPTRGCVRCWERHFIKSYRCIHGVRRRPLKNRRD